MSGSSVQKPRFTVNAQTPVRQLISVGCDGHVAVLYEGSTAVLRCDGTLVWSSDAQHVAAAQFGSSVALLEATGGGTILKVSDDGLVVEDLFLDSVASGDAAVSTASGGPHGCLALASGRRLLVVDDRHEVQRDILVQPGCEPSQLCWAARLLCSTSSCGVQAWQSHGAWSAQVLPGSPHGADFTCLQSSPSGSLLAAGASDGQVLVWLLGCADDAVDSARLLHKLPHNAAVDIVKWDLQSERLAVSDGAAVSLWDVGATKDCAGDSAPALTVCCGHQQLARITAVAFHESSPMLATGADHGQVLVYNTADAAPGMQLQPVMRAAVSSFADCCSCRVSALVWLPTGALAAGCDDGRMVSWSVAAPDSGPASGPASSPAADASAQAPPDTVPSSPKRSVAASASAPQLHVSRASGDASQRRPPAPGSSPAGPSLAAARRSAAAALAAATQVHGAAAAAARQRTPPRSGRTFRSASAPLDGGCVAAVLAAAQRPPGCGSEAADDPAAELGAGSAPSPSSSQLGDSSATTDEVHAAHTLESPVRSVLPPCPADLAACPPCSSASAPGPGEAPQPPPTPPSARGSRPRRTNRRSNSNSHSSLADSIGGSHASNPDFQRRRSIGSLAVHGAPSALSAPSTPQRLPQQAAMSGQWSPSGPPPPFRMFVPGSVPMPPSPSFMRNGMAMPPSPGYPQAPYMGPTPMAYMQTPMGLVPVLVQPQGHWAPYPPAAGYPPPAMTQGYHSVPQSPTWHASPMPQYAAGMPPMSPSSTYGDFTCHANGTASTPSQSATGNGTGMSLAQIIATTKPAARCVSSPLAYIVKCCDSCDSDQHPVPLRSSTGSRSRASKRSSRSKAASCNSCTSPEQPPPELSRDSSPCQKANLTEAFGAAADVAVPVTTIYVGNLPAGVNEHMLQLAFAVFGTITACEVVRDRMNGESRGFAFVTFAHASCAAGAMANMAGAVLPGVFQDRPLNVAPSTRDQQAQMQQASTRSAVQAASATQQGPTAPGSPQSGIAAAHMEHGQQMPHVQQTESQGPETLEQLQNGQPLTEAQQRQMQLSAAKQLRAAEQRQQLVERARQVVAAAGCNSQQTRAGTDDASASAGLSRQQHPRPAAGAVAPAELAAQLVAKLGAAAVMLDAAAPQDVARPAADEGQG